MQSNYEKIKEFHRVFGRKPDPMVPTVTSIESRLLRGNLILEEFQELIAELGLQMQCEIVPVSDDLDNDSHTIDVVLKEIPGHEIKLDKVAKECADLLVVTYGTGASMGLPMDEAYAAVHESNMSKLGPDGSVIRREDGKVLKGPNYKEPNMKKVIYNEQ